jgi:glycosyltransferase involved in cell wall biosynthesis
VNHSQRGSSLNDRSSTPIRVAHVLGNLQPGGLNRLVLSLIRELPSYSHTVIFNSGDRGAFYEEFAASSRMIQCSYTRRSVTSALGYLPRLTRVLRKESIDVVVAHLFGNHALVSLAGRLAGVRATYGVSANDPVHYARSRWQPLLLSQVARPFCRGEIAVSEAIGTVLRNDLRLPASRVHVIANGCDVEEFAARAASTRAAVRTRGGDPRLLMVAWLQRAKDHETVIRALAVLRSRGIRVQFDIAGAASRQAKQEQLLALATSLGVSDSVTFLGHREDIPELMGASDIVVHATHSEGFGVVLIEAFASGTPLIASDIPACREVLDGGRCGLLVPPRDPHALADAIQRLLTDDTLRHSLVAAASERVRAKYDVHHMAAGYAALIESAVRR